MAVLPYLLALDKISHADASLGIDPMDAERGHCESSADITVDRGLFLTREGGVYDRCTIKAIIWCFESF
jgi:hypothetical protein